MYRRRCEKSSTSPSSMPSISRSPVFAVAPLEAEAARELGLEDPVVQRPRGGLGGQQRAAVESSPLAVLTALGAVEHEAVGVQLRVAVSGAPLVHAGHDQPRGVEGADAVAPGADVGGVVLEVVEPGVHGSQVGGPHLCLDVRCAEGPEQRHRLDRREGAVPRGHRRARGPHPDLVAGVPASRRILDLLGGRECLGAECGGLLLGAEPGAEPHAVGANALGVQRLERGSCHLAVEVERGRTATPPGRAGRRRSVAPAVLVAVGRHVLGQVVAGDATACLGEVVLDGAAAGVDLGEAEHGGCLPGSMR